MSDPEREKTYDPVECNLCGCRDYSQVRHFAHWDLGREPVSDVSVIRCGRCGVRRRMPGIADDYEEEYHAPYVDQGQAIHPHQLSHFSDLMTARLRQFGATGLRLLDVGCSTGRVLQLAKTMGFEATGLDYSRWAAEHCARLGFEARHGSLIGQFAEPAVFDVIHCSHTIEHVPDPVVYLQEMFRLIKPGGQVMIAMPNYASVPRLLLREKWPIWCLDSHLWQFTARQMVRLIRSAGFTINSCRTLHGFTPDSRMKLALLNLAAAAGFGDGCNIVATKAR